jgi:hypothetical protein
MIAKLKAIVKPSVYKLIQPHRPNFLIIGAQKAGTTSLHYYLHQHPLLQGALDKEVSFFSTERNFQLDVNWYHSQFKDVRNPFPNKKTLFFESTPEYIYYKKALERIYNYNKDLKLILILREPVSRAYSAWNMFRDFKSRPNGIPESLINDKSSQLYEELYDSKSFPSFEQAIDNESQKISKNSNCPEPSFIRRGMYVEQIKFLFSLFDKSQILILDFDELQTNKAKTLNNVLSFLDLENFDWDKNSSHKSYNKRPYTSKIDKITKSNLETFYKPYNEELFKLIHQKFDW